MKILVIAAHPDDEVLGAGGIMAKHVDAGDDVHVCIATKGHEPEWTAEYQSLKVVEQAVVDAMLGVTKRFNLDFPTVKLNTIPAGEFNKKVTGVVDEVQPRIVYTHYPHDVNLDHAIVHAASVVATRPPKKIKLACYETLSESEWNGTQMSPNLWVDISPFIEKKKALFNIYASEVKDYPHPRSLCGIEYLARKRGMEACLEFAEAFMILRDFW